MSHSEGRLEEAGTDRMEPVEKHVEGSLLLAAYGALLTDAQRELMELYYNEDLSLHEIAEEQGISRQGVHDMVTRALKKFEGYEARLGLLAQSARRSEELNRCLNLAKTLPKDSGRDELISALEGMIMEEEQP